MDINHYNGLKTQYIALKKMDGGGAWDSYSNANDATQETLNFIGIHEYRGDDLIIQNDRATISKGLKKMFKSFDSEIRGKDPNIKNTDRSIYNLNYKYLGVKQCD
jgi:hypothetical protein